MKQLKPMEFRVGADIGGTFTDIVLSNPEGVFFTRKVASTPDDYTRAIASGLSEIFSEVGLNGASIAGVVHGTTVATNAILEHTGARTGLITTKGFRDILEIRRFRMPKLYDFTWEKPLTLVPRYLRLEVDERINSKGEILRPLDVNGTIQAIQRLVSDGVESVAVCLLHSYANPVHELKVGDLLREKFPQLHFTLSSQLIPMIGEYERTSEAVVNAYIQPVVMKYLAILRETLGSLAIKAPLLIMQSNGGMMSNEAAMEKPIHIIECGPAAGVVGCAYLAKKMAFPNVVTLDMGGTTAKASIIEGGQFARSSVYEVGAEISSVSRLSSGGGYTLRVPSIDIAEIGAGGGTVLWIDAGGVLHAGPRSAGAVPGPVCYDTGGEEPTLTDANLVLGYLNPNYLVGGGLKLNGRKAYQVLLDKVAKPLNMEVVEAAYGSYLIANSNMTRAVSAVSTERGRDPRAFILFAFGGAGPLHAVGVARMLKMRRVIIPPSPGLFSAFGLLSTQIEHYYVKTFGRHLDESVQADINQCFEKLIEEALAAAKLEGGNGARIIIEKYADLRYVGQASELTSSVPWETIGPSQLVQLKESFNQEHQKTYGHSSPADPVEMVDIRVISKVLTAPLVLPSVVGTKEPSVQPLQPPPTRKAYFGPDYGWLEALILKPGDLYGYPKQGPLIVEGYDSTTIIPPGCEAVGGDWGTIIIDIK